MLLQTCTEHTAFLALSFNSDFPVWNDLSYLEAYICLEPH